MNVIEIGAPTIPPIDSFWFGHMGGAICDPFGFALGDWAPLVKMSKKETQITSSETELCSSFLLFSRHNTIIQDELVIVRFEQLRGKKSKTISSSVIALNENIDHEDFNL